ncbi:MAG: class I SAM-dependent RNA methyltransferase [Betaproteobacteria bacterium]|nr:class I SAM-dependent RNA methyltransferase [Betaproteobacteria bacterium]
MNALHLFLPCAAGVEDLLAAEVLRITQLPQQTVHKRRGGVRLEGSWRDMLLLNLHSRLAQRVLVQLAQGPYDNEQDIYRTAFEVAWEIWFTPAQTFKVELTAHHSPLKSLNFATLRIKDAVCDRFRERAGDVRPSIDTHWPDVRVFGHLTADQVTVYIDTSGEPLFKRGWREDKGDAPLKETLAAAILAASGWSDATPRPALYDPCCGSGTICIEAAQIACGIPSGIQRRFGFEKLLPFQTHVWEALRQSAIDAVRIPDHTLVFGSDVAFRVVDFAQRNAERAGVADVIEFRGGDALQRMPPTDTPGVIVLNPPYGERIEVAGVAGVKSSGLGREAPQMQSLEADRPGTQAPDGAGAFFTQLASHWKKHYAGWTAWLLTPDLKLPTQMRLKETRRVPMWNGPIECRLFKFDMVQGTARGKAAPVTQPNDPA